MTTGKLADEFVRRFSLPSWACHYGMSGLGNDVIGGKDGLIVALGANDGLFTAVPLATESRSSHLLNLLAGAHVRRLGRLIDNGTVERIWMVAAEKDFDMEPIHYEIAWSSFLAGIASPSDLVVRIRLEDAARNMDLIDQLGDTRRFRFLYSADPSVGTGTVELEWLGISEFHQFDACDMMILQHVHEDAASVLNRSLAEGYLYSALNDAGAPYPLLYRDGYAMSLGFEGTSRIASRMMGRLMGMESDSEWDAAVSGLPEDLPLVSGLDHPLGRIEPPYGSSSSIVCHVAIPDAGAETSRNMALRSSFARWLGLISIWGKLGLHGTIRELGGNEARDLGSYLEIWDEAARRVSACTAAEAATAALLAGVPPDDIL